MDLKEPGYEACAGFAWLMIGTGYEHGNNPSGSIKCRGFL